MSKKILHHTGYHKLQEVISQICLSYSRWLRGSQAAGLRHHGPACHSDAEGLSPSLLS